MGTQQNTLNYDLYQFTTHTVHNSMKHHWSPTHQLTIYAVTQSFSGESSPTTIHRETLTFPVPTTAIATGLLLLIALWKPEGKFTLRTAALSESRFCVLYTTPVAVDEAKSFEELQFSSSRNAGWLIPGIDFCPFLVNEWRPADVQWSGERRKQETLFEWPSGIFEEG